METQPPLQIRTLQEYIPLALRTKSPGRMAPVFDGEGKPVLDEKGKQVKTLIASGPMIDMEHFTLGILSEGGESVGALKKGFYGNVFDEVNYFEELGDKWWYVAIGLDALCQMLPEEDRSRWLDHVSQIFETQNWIGLDELMHATNGFDLRNQRVLASISRVLLAEMAAYNFDPEFAEDLEVDGDEEPVELEAHTTEEAVAAEPMMMNTHSVPMLMSYVTGTLTNVLLLTAAFAAFRYRTTDPQVVHAELSRIWVRNIEKLRARYPDKFDSVRALERTSLEAERQILQA